MSSVFLQHAGRSSVAPRRLTLAERSAVAATPRARPAPPFSRAVLYVIDPATRTARQIWEHRDVRPDGTPQFAGFLGDADKLANGNVLITHGGAATEAGLNYSRIVEVTPDYETGENTIVLDLQTGDQAAVGYTAYRAERLPSLYLGAAS